MTPKEAANAKKQFSIEKTERQIEKFYFHIKNGITMQLRKGKSSYTIMSSGIIHDPKLTWGIGKSLMRRAQLELNESGYNCKLHDDQITISWTIEEIVETDPKKAPLNITQMFCDVIVNRQNKRFLDVVDELYCENGVSRELP